MGGSANVDELVGAPRRRVFGLARRPTSPIAWDGSWASSETRPLGCRKSVAPPQVLIEKIGRAMPTFFS